MSGTPLICLASISDISKRVSPSYFFSSFMLHENARELHKYTREQKKKGAGEGTGFDGELDNFQGPTLSSLSKLVRLGCNFLPLIHTDLLFGQNMDDIFRL